MTIHAFESVNLNTYGTSDFLYYFEDFFLELAMYLPLNSLVSIYWNFYTSKWKHNTLNGFGCIILELLNCTDRTDTALIYIIYVWQREFKTLLKQFVSFTNNASDGVVAAIVASKKPKLVPKHYSGTQIILLGIWLPRLPIRPGQVQCLSCVPFPVTSSKFAHKTDKGPVIGYVCALLLVQLR